MVPIEDQIPEDILNWKITETDDSVLHPSETLGKQIYVDKDGSWSL